MEIINKNKARWEILWDLDVIVDILKWLSKNELIRVQLVCSKWYTVRVPHCLEIDTWEYDNRRWVESMLAEAPDKALCGDRLLELQQNMKPITLEFMQDLLNKLCPEFLMIDRKMAHFAHWTREIKENDLTNFNGSTISYFNGKT